MRFEGEGSYASSGNGQRWTSYEWYHSMGQIVSALIGAGMRIEFLHEFPHCPYKSHPWLSQGDDGLWRYEAAPRAIPLTLSMKVREE